MRNLIVGNGVNIQFSGSEYINTSIMQRSINNEFIGLLSQQTMPVDIRKYVFTLFDFFPRILNGDYDHFALYPGAKETLPRIKNVYGKYESLKITDVMFEDYFYINEIFNIVNRTQSDIYDYQEWLRHLFLDAIWNGGHVNTLFKMYPPSFIKWLAQFDKIYTTNYDKNLDEVVDINVGHLHGSFSILDDKYDRYSLRNLVRKTPESPSIPQEIRHLLSNAIMTYSASFKAHMMRSHYTVNTAFKTMIENASQNSDLQHQIDQLVNSNDDIPRKIYEAYQRIRTDSHPGFPDYYSFEEFQNIKGDITFIGLKLRNDLHILKNLVENPNISEITFYYYTSTDKEQCNEIFINQEINYQGVQSFWEDIMDNYMI